MLRNVSAIHLLWTLSVLKTYDSFTVLSAHAGVSEKTFSEWVWRIVPALAALKEHVIKWENWLKEDVGYPCLVSVDGTDFRIPQQKPFSTTWYLHKIIGPGLQYKLAVSIIGGDIVWVNGPFKAGLWPDLPIFKGDLANKLLQGEKSKAHKGYAGNIK